MEELHIIGVGGAEGRGDGQRVGQSIWRPSNDDPSMETRFA